MFPWANTIILTLLALILLAIRRMWLQFRERTIAPMVEDAEEAWDNADDRARGFWRRMFGR